MSSGRSGSTWFAKLFDTHPDVLYRHEPDSVVREATLPYHPLRSEYDKYKTVTADYLSALENIRTVKTTMRRPFFEKSFRKPLTAKLHQSAGYIAALGERLNIPSAITPIPDSISRNHKPALLVTKSVSSMGRMGLFAHADPNLRFIHLIRHPAAVAASKLRGVNAGVLKPQSYHAAALNLPTAKQYPFTQEEAESWSFPEQCALAWLIFNDSAAQTMAENNQYRAVCYEDFCNNYETALPDLFSFAGLSWNENTENFLSSLKTADASNNQHFNIMRPPTASLFKWKSALSKDQISGIQRITSFAITKTVQRAAQF